MMPPDTVLIALTGATTGVTALLKIKASANQSVTGILPSAHHIPRYLYYYLSSLREKIIDQSYGGAQKHISQGFVKKLIIPLPSLNDQKRIVKILDQSDALRQKRKQASALLDGYLKAVFLEMFGDPVKNPKGWEIEQLGCLADEFKYGTNTISDANNIDHKMPILRIPNIIGERINYIDLKYSVIEEKEKEKIRLRYGDLLFVRTNGNPAYIGRCAVFCDSIDCGYASYLIRARLKIDSPVKSTFIRDVISYPTYRHLVVAKAKTTAGNYNINTESLKSLKIYLPPLDLQSKFSKIVERAEELKLTMLAQSEELENQFQALMQKAFKGEL
jgi:type I restriction enzyme S subunit